jgi:hypothetical protein
LHVDIYGHVQFNDVYDNMVKLGEETKTQTDHALRQSVREMFNKGILKATDGTLEWFIDNVADRRMPKLEPKILKSAWLSLKYASIVLKQRWPKGEPVIARDPGSAEYYAKEIIKGRWPEGEPAIASVPMYACDYAKEIIKGRWPEAERVMLSQKPVDAYRLAQYAEQVIKGPWPEAEPFIATNSSAAWLYVCRAINERLPEAEPVIAKAPHIAKEYNKKFGTNLNYDSRWSF